MVECKLSLELTKNGIQQCVHAKQGESKSRRLLITLTEKSKVFDLEGYEARVSYDDKTYTKATIDGNVVEFILPSTLLSGPGERLCELEISVPGESILYSPMFIVNVEGSLGAEAKNEAVGKGVEYQQVIPDLEETADMGEETYIAVYEKGKGTKKYKVKGLGGASKHSELSGRDEDDQHPISAISELEQRLKDINEVDNALWDEATRIDLSVQGLETKSNNQGDRITANEKQITANKNNISDLQNLSHSHENKNVLDRIGVSVNNKPTFDKVEIGGGSADINIYALATQMIAAMFVSNTVYTRVEPDTNGWIDGFLGELAFGGGLTNIVYAPGVTESITINGWIGFESVSLTLNVAYNDIVVFKGDSEAGTNYYAHLKGDEVRQLMVNGFDSIESKYQSF